MTTRTTLLWLIALAALHSAIMFPWLTRVPRVIMDESWEATTGWSLVAEGRLRNPVIPDRDGLDQAFVQPRVTQSFVLAAAYRLLGFSLASGRLASVAIGLLAAWGVFFLLRTWMSAGLAGLATALYVVDCAVFLVARVVRPEIYLVCAAVWMLALLARGIEPGVVAAARTQTGGSERPSGRARLWMCLAAGLVGGLGCSTHPNMLLVIVPTLPMFFWRLGFGRRAWAAVACYGVGGAIAASPFIAWVVYAHAHWGVSMWAQLGGWYVDPLDDFGHALLREVRRWWGFLLLPHRAPWVLVVLASVVAGLFRRTPAHVWGLSQILGHAILCLMAIRKGSPHYLAVISPWLAAFVALWASQLWSAAVAATGTFRRRALQAVAIACCAGTLAVHLAGNAYIAYRYRGADYDGLCRRLGEKIPAGARIYGDYVFWTGFHLHPYLSEMGEWTSGRDVGQFLERRYARLRNFGARFVIRSSDMCWELDGFRPRPAEFRRDLNAPREDDFREAVEEQTRDRYIRSRGGVLIDKISTADFGTIELYCVP